MKVMTMVLCWTGLGSLGIALAAFGREAELAFKGYERSVIDVVSSARVDPRFRRKSEDPQAAVDKPVDYATPDGYGVKTVISRWRGVGLHGLILLACEVAWMLVAWAGAGWGARPRWIRAAVWGSIVGALGSAAGSLVYLLWINGWQQFAMKWRGHEGPTAFLIMAEVGALIGALIGAAIGAARYGPARAAALTKGNLEQQ